MAQKAHSWWQATTSTFKGILGFIGVILGLAPLFSQHVSDFLKEWWILGWTLALIFFLTSAVLFVGAGKLQKTASMPTVDPENTVMSELKRNELIADLATIEEWLRPFMSRSKIRERLERISDPKYFSKELYDVFDRLGNDFNDLSKELFTSELVEVVAETKRAYVAYWSKLEPVLDAPDEIRGNDWDLKVISPPGGGWKGENISDQYESFYAFVRTLTPLLHTFLEKVAIVEKTANRLKIQAGFSAQQPTN